MEQRIGSDVDRLMGVEQRGVASVEAPGATQDHEARAVDDARFGRRERDEHGCGERSCQAGGFNQHRSAATDFYGSRHV